MAKLEFMLMFICLTSMVVNIDSAGSTDKRIERLEDQLFNIEEKIDEEARIRRYDIRAIMVKLSLIPTLLRAFQTEKKLSLRTRRHIDGLKTDLGNMTNLISELMENTSDVNSKVDDVVEAIHDLNKISEAIQEMNGTIKANAMSTLNKLAAQDNTVNEIRQLLTRGNKQFASCFELLKVGYADNGLYDIYPNGRITPIKVYCDQATDGGGWIVFQRRQDGSENFYRAWIDYENGFGNPASEFWLGNEYLHLLTAPCCRELRIDMEDFENNKRYVKYGKFGIGPKATNYVLTYEDYTGDAGDSLSYNNGMAFSTHDNENDKSSVNCASRYKGAWWYNYCTLSNLNGNYTIGADDATGVYWYTWKMNYYSLKFTEMKLR